MIAENGIIIQSKAVLYQRFVDDIYSRRKLRENVLFHQLGNCHPNIKLTIEINPINF